MHQGGRECSWDALGRWSSRPRTARRTAPPRSGAGRGGAGAGRGPEAAVREAELGRRGVGDEVERGRRAPPRRRLGEEGAVLRDARRGPRRGGGAVDELGAAEGAAEGVRGAGEGAGARDEEEEELEVGVVEEVGRQAQRVAGLEEPLAAAAARGRRRGGSIWGGNRGAAAATTGAAAVKQQRRRRQKRRQRRRYRSSSSGSISGGGGGGGGGRGSAGSSSIGGGSGSRLRLRAAG